MSEERRKDGWMEEEFQELNRKIDKSLELLNSLGTGLAVLNSEVKTHFESDAASFKDVKESFADAKSGLEQLRAKYDWLVLKVALILGVGAGLAFVAGFIFK